MKLVDIYLGIFKNNLLWLKKALIWSIIWLFFGTAVYLFWPGTQDVFRKILTDFFQDVVSDPSFGLNLATFWSIFKNNLIAGFLSLILGFFLGIVPLITLALNFFVVGYLLSWFTLSYPSGPATGLAIFFATILPHGLIEIPALIICGAFGIKLGMFWLKSSVHLKKVLREILQISPLLILMFVIAALIEVFITGRIASWLAI